MDAWLRHDAGPYCPVTRAPPVQYAPSVHAEHGYVMVRRYCTLRASGAISSRSEGRRWAG